jgi:hypothetical protein
VLSKPGCEFSSSVCVLKLPQCAGNERLKEIGLEKTEVKNVLINAKIQGITYEANGGLCPITPVKGATAEIKTTIKELEEELV